VADLGFALAANVYKQNHSGGGGVIATGLPLAVRLMQE